MVSLEARYNAEVGLTFRTVVPGGEKKEIKKIYYELPIEQQKNIISNIFQKI